MGNFRVVVEAVGNHGCQRDRKDGEAITGCDQQHCTDCMAREFLRRLKRGGAQISKAEIQHWPMDLTGASEDSPHPVDDILAGVRHGSF